MSDNKGFGKIILVMGVALLLVGIGVGVYVGVFGSPVAYAGNDVPGWFGNVIAVTFAIFGFALIALGVRELGVHFFGNM